MAAAAGARGGPAGASYGLAVGPVWALTLWLAAELHVVGFGQPDLGSTFLMTLLVGSVLGAVGGALSARLRPLPAPG